jgi:hypothetical protein
VKIKSSLWKLSAIRIADIGYVPEYERVLLTDGDIAEFKSVDPKGFILWDIFDTDTMQWLSTEDISPEEVAGVLIPPWVNSIEELEEHYIEDMLTVFRDTGKYQYQVLILRDSAEPTIKRLRREARRRYRKGGS